MSRFIARKERIVEAFISTISDLDSKSCDEIENNLYEIIKKTRGLIYADQYTDKNHTSKQTPFYWNFQFHTGTNVDGMQGQLNRYNMYRRTEKF